MSVSKYQMFLKTVECGSFSRAAEELNFTQSGVSHAIGSLEEELGVTLLVRSHGGVTPTADGRALAPYFQEMCALSHRLEQHAEDLRGLDTGLIRVATFTSVSEKWLPGMLKTFQEKYPRIEFELLPSNFNNEISDWVLHGQADCGFISLPTPAEKYLDYWLLQRDQWKVILPCDHPLAGRDPFPPEALEDIRLFRASGEPVDADVYLPDVPGYAYIYVNGFSAGDYLVAGGEKLTLEGWHSLTAPEKSAAAS